MHFINQIGRLSKDLKKELSDKKPRYICTDKFHSRGDFDFRPFGEGCKIGQHLILRQVDSGEMANRESFQSKLWLSVVRGKSPLGLGRRGSGSCLGDVE